MCITDCDNNLKERSGSHERVKDEWQLADGNLGGGEEINVLDEEIAFAEILRQKKLKVI